MYLLPPGLLADFLLQCRDSPSLAGRVRGVLSEPGPAPSYSQAAAAPLADYALYANRSYPWNPAGEWVSGRTGRGGGYALLHASRCTDSAPAWARPCHSSRAALPACLPRCAARAACAMQARG